MAPGHEPATRRGSGLSEAIIIKKKDAGALRKKETHQKNDPLKFRLHIVTSPRHLWSVFLL